jgi:hypothetical protein
MIVANPSSSSSISSMSSLATASFSFSSVRSLTIGIDVSFTTVSELGVGGDDQSIVISVAVEDIVCALKYAFFVIFPPPPLPVMLLMLPTPLPIGCFIVDVCWVTVIAGICVTTNVCWVAVVADVRLSHIHDNQPRYGS